jgi:hypothetical protein
MMTPYDKLFGKLAKTGDDLFSIKLQLVRMIFLVGNDLPGYKTKTIAELSERFKRLQNIPSEGLNIAEVYKGMRKMRNSLSVELKGLQGLINDMPTRRQFIQYRIDVLDDFDLLV